MPSLPLTLLATTAALLTTPTVYAHIALWHPSMFGWDPSDGNQQEPVNPLYNLPYSEWWMHGYKGKPPASGELMQLPAGGTFHGQVGCNKAWTTWGANPAQWNATWACDGPAPTHGLGALHTSDSWEDPAPHDVKGCALAIAYTSDENAVTPEEMTVFSVNYTCPWKRDVDFQVPADLPACPPGGCICTWNWIHSDDAGSEQIYNLAYRCEVTGASNTRALTKTPMLANKCPTDKSNCTVGPKVPFYWLQAERNNIFQDYYDPPFYNGDYGFANGAQNDLFVGVAASSSSSSSASRTSASSSSSKASSSTSSKVSSSSTITSTVTSSAKTTSAAPSSTSSKPASSPASSTVTSRASSATSSSSSKSSSSTSSSSSSSVKSSSSSSAVSSKASSSSSSSTSAKTSAASSSSSTRVTSTSSTSSKRSAASASTSSPAATPSSSPPAAGSILGYNYAGCISDGTYRVMSSDAWQSDSMTLQQCAQHCTTTMNSTYFGVEYGTQCYCANTLNYNMTLDASQCGMTCAGGGGDASQASGRCGGSWTMSLWARPAAVAATGSGSSSCSAATTATVTKTVTVTANAGTPTRRSMWGKARMVSRNKTAARMTDDEREARRKAWDAEAERESKAFFA